MKRVGILIIGLLGLITSNAQHSLSGGFLPKINLSAKVSKKIKLVYSTESRQQFYQSEEVQQFQYKNALTDFTALVSTKIQANQSINTGYMIRFRDGEVFHRFIQQYNLVQYFDFLRMGHRLATDQTFSSDSDAKYRIRYRITIEKSLSGDEVDPREFYIKLGNEYLWEVTRSQSELEIRLLPMLGFEISKRNRIETGIDYRLSEILGAGAASALRLSLIFYQSF
jgi:hypothetical protein